MSNTVVRTNIMSLNAHRNMGLVGNQQSKSSQRLSSGYRINSAADDAAGLGISEKMRAQIRGLDQASRNGQDGISLIQTAEGAMATINEMVSRIRELVVQAANDTNVHDDTDAATTAQSDRVRIQDEIDQLLAEIDATRNRVEFNTRTLLDGSLDGLDSASRNATASTAATAGTAGTAALDSTAAVTASTLTPGNSQNTNDTIFTTELSPSTGTVASTGSTAATAGTAGITGRPEGTGLWFHVGANSNQGVKLNIADIGVDSMSILGKDAVRNAVRQAVNNSFTLSNLTAADFEFANLRSVSNGGTGSNEYRSGGVLRESGEEINLFLTGIDMALAHVTGERSNLGAMQNRLEYTIENLDIASENLSAAESRIRDADMAKEMMSLTQANVLQQAAISMLAQANQAPQSVLQLLG